ncbi:MAG: hypothetical protein WCR98_05750 [Saccharofermentanales bacterium]
MSICYWECPQCGCRIKSPDIPEVGMNCRYADREVTEDDVTAAYDEYDEAIEAHQCRQ